MFLELLVKVNYLNYKCEKAKENKEKKTLFLQSIEKKNHS